MSSRCLGGSFTVFLLSLLFTGAGYAQMANSSISFAGRGLGAYSSNFQDVFSVADNVASVTGAKSLGGGMIGERRFMLQELSQYRLVAVYSDSLATMAVELQFSGFSAYNESTASLSYG